MDLKSILMKAGGAVLSSVIPGGGLIVDLINSFLPSDTQVPKNATGTQAISAIQQLPPDKQAEVFTKELDVEIEEIRGFVQVQQALSEADASGASTRPYIAKLMAYCVCFVTWVFSVMWILAISYDNTTTIRALTDSWPLMLTVLGTPTALLRAYFGMRTKEKKSRYHIASGQPDNTLLNTITGLFGGK